MPPDNSNKSLVQRLGNKILVSGACHLQYSETLFSELHQAIFKAGYENIILDMSNAQAFFADIAVPLCAIIRDYKSKGVEFELIINPASTVGRTFLNSNWAHIIDERYLKSAYKGFQQHPASIYREDNELVKSLNSILDCMLKSSAGLIREDLAVLEWSLNEIMENSLRHSESCTGGIVHLSKFDKNRNVIEIVVADAGQGIPKSLSTVEGYKHLRDHELLELAIKEGVTNGKGMGNGLFGASSTSVASGGRFTIRSKNAFLTTYLDSGRPTTLLGNKTIPLMGTAIIASYDYSSPRVLQNALKIKGKVYTPIDYVEQYEGECLIHLKNEVEHFSTRTAAEGLRAKLLSIYRLASIEHFVFDFQDVPTMSSSFADELLGKLKVTLGEKDFFNKAKFKNLSPINTTIVERAINQRTSL